MPLSRDSLSDDSFRQKIVDEAPDHVELMDDAAFEASRQDILARAAELPEFWVFGYGSLIWNPIIEIADAKPARLHGYARRFCVWAPVGRGSPDCQGLWLGLDAGGNCEGVALRVDNAKRDAETLILWRREMIGGVYRPELLPVEIGGESKPCLVFLANSEHPRYADHVARQAKVEAIARAQGSMGTCREYLYALDERLSAHGLGDPYISDLTVDVRAIAAD